MTKYKRLCILGLQEDATNGRIVCGRLDNGFSNFFKWGPT